MLPCVNAALAVPDNVDPLDAEALLEVGHRRAERGGVVADGAEGIESSSGEAHIPGGEADAPGGSALEGVKARQVVGAAAPAVREEDGTPGEARLVVGLQGQPVKLERQSQGDVAGKPEGDFVGASAPAPSRARAPTPP